MYLYAWYINESELICNIYIIYNINELYSMHIGVTRSEYFSMCSRA